ncbi:hypothetical protein RKD23_003117 [Streptomyces sp. SAI-170]|uniref:hypothetical protein n=1 Tax=Streptomyces sp. SAI-170 TaxID=3377729 RepID=UPI003C79AF39
MGLSVRTRGGATLAGLSALLLAGGAVGCGGDKGDRADRTPFQVLTAAYEKTAEAKSAKVHMTMSAPGMMGGGDKAIVSGVMGWDPAVMDLTVEGYAAEPDMPEKIRMIMRDDVMYMDGGKEAAAEMDGKRWMKLDFGAAAEAAGNEDLARQMTAGMDNMNQNPAEQIALLLESPNLKHVGSGKVGGVEAEHYKGTLTVAEMMKTNKALDVLKPAERKQLLDNIEKSGIKGYDTEVWVNDDDLPVRMDVGIDTPEGDVDMSMTFSDYGTKAEVEVPPASETFDLMEMFKGLGEDGAFDESAINEDTLDLEGLDDSEPLGTS